MWMGVEESVKVWKGEASVASYLHFTHDPEHSGNNHITSQDWHGGGLAKRIETGVRGEKLRAVCPSEDPLSLCNTLYLGKVTLVTIKALRIFNINFYNEYIQF